jgi:hypothetical protein
MKQIESFIVRVILQVGGQWAGTFVGGRPTPDDILDAIDDKTSDYTALVRDHLLPEDNLCVCTYAGTKVGEIEIVEQPRAFVMEAPSVGRIKEEQLPSFMVEDDE